MSASVGAVILGNEYQALGLLRQLRTNGIPCVLVDADRWGVALLSRYRCKFHRSPPYEGDDLIPWLKDLVRTHGYEGWVVMPTDDEQVRHLATHHDDIKDVLRYAGLSWGKYRIVYNKRLAYGLASELGIAIPETFIPISRNDFNGMNLSYPFIIKPAVKRTFKQYSKKKAIPVRSQAELVDVLDNLLSAVPLDDLLLQEIVPGNGQAQWSYAGFFIEGEPVAAFTACRRRQHPPDYGRASTYVVAVHDAEVEFQSQRILRELKLTGLAEVEWKRDVQDGKLKFLEVNGRCWGWHSLASQVVGNLPKMLYDYLVQGTCRKVEPVYGKRWIKWVTDVPVALHLMLKGQMPIADYMKSIFGDAIWCEWDQKDPLPLFAQTILLPYLLLKRGY